MLLKELTSDPLGSISRFENPKLIRYLSAPERVRAFLARMGGMKASATPRWLSPTITAARRGAMAIILAGMALDSYGAIIASFDLEVLTVMVGSLRGVRQKDPSPRPA